MWKGGRKTRTIERTVGFQQLPASLRTPTGEFHELRKPLLAAHLLGSNCMQGLVLWSRKGSIKLDLTADWVSPSLRMLGTPEPQLYPVALCHLLPCWFWMLCLEGDGVKCVFPTRGP